MSYTKTVWGEHSMSEAEKLAALTNLEKQYDEVITAALAHDHDTIYYTKALADARFFGVGNDGSGSGMDAGTLDGYTADAIISASIPAGLILMYAGTGYTLPEGWAAYADMNGKFPVGAGATYALKATGGSSNTGALAEVSGVIGAHSISESEMPAHTHSFNEYQNTPDTQRKNDSNAHICWLAGYVSTHTDYAKDAAGTYAANYSHWHGCSISISGVDHTPPNVVLQFVKKT